jgi:hypothetical protein
MAPANTGIDRRSKIAVISTAHGKRGMRSSSMPSTRKFPKVLIKFTAPSKEETPARCKEKIAKSTEAPEWAILLLNGG